MVMTMEVEYQKNDADEKLRLEELKKINRCVNIAATLYSILLLPTGLIALLALAMADMFTSSVTGCLTLFFALAIPGSMLLSALVLDRRDWTGRYRQCLIWCWLPVGVVAIAYLCEKVLQLFLGNDVFILLG